jgi:hypothetical protein
MTDDLRPESPMPAPPRRAVLPRLDPSATGVMVRCPSGALTWWNESQAALDAERAEVERLTAALQHARDCFAVLDMGACTVRNGDYAPDEVCGKMSDYEDLRAALERKP